MDELVAALTSPLSDDDKKKGFLTRDPRPRMLQPDTAANPEKIFHDNLCFPETEDGLPAGWNPLYVQKGFKQGESVVSTFTGWSISNFGGYINLPHHEIMKWQLQNFFTSGTGTNGSATLLVDPVAARDLKERFDTKEELAEWLAQNATTAARHYWARGEDPLIQAKSGVEPFASYLKLGEFASLPVLPFIRRPIAAKPSAQGRLPAGPPRSPIEIIVVGGGTNAFWVAGDFSYVSSASVDKWR